MVDIFTMLFLATRPWVTHDVITVIIQMLSLCIAEADYPSSYGLAYQCLVFCGYLYLVK